MGYRRDRVSAPDRALSVLAVTSEVPWPLNTGGHLRTFHLLRALAHQFRVRLVTATLAGQEAAIEALGQNGIIVHPAVIGPRVRWREVLRAGAVAMGGEPYVLYRRHDRQAVRTVLRNQLVQESPDLLYLDHLDSLVFRDLQSRTPAIIDLHNVYSTLARRASGEQTTWWSSLYLLRESRLLAKMERRAVRTADRLFAVSEEDGRYFEALGARALSIIPNGMDCAVYQALPTGRRMGTPVILYVGAMSWGPNVGAAKFLATNVLPRVRARIPDARLRVVGRDPLPEVTALGSLPGVEVTGAVPNVIPHLGDAHILAVPLEAGGGTRLKILEAFAAGLPVVSTPVGCEGLSAAHGEHLLIADREHFVESIVSLLGDQTLGDRLAARARQLVRASYDWSTIGEAACAAVRAAVHSRG